MDSKLIIFISTVFVISSIPGLNVMLIISQSINGGIRTSLLSISGIVTGNIIYLLVSLLGLGVFLIQFPTAFIVLKSIGVAFTLYSAYSLIKASFQNEDATLEVKAHTRGKNFVQGFLTVVSNPKAFVFWMTVLPNFINSGSGDFLSKVAFLGILAITIDTAILFCYAVLSSMANRIIKRSKKIQLLVSGLILIGVAVWLAFS
jgi:homoserine/homoserine lactone efflux protein